MGASSRGSSSGPQSLDLVVAQLSPRAPPEVAELEPRVAWPVEARHGESDRGAHPLDLVLASLVDRELELIRPEPLRARGCSATVVEIDAFAELSQLIVVRVPLDLDLVGFLYAVARVREAVRERSVVRQQERAGRVGVEAPDRNDTRFVADEIDDCRPSLRIARGGDDSRGLVEKYVGKALRGDRVPVDLDSVGLLDERVQLTRLAVHRYPAGLDQLVCTATRRDARAGEVGVQPHSS
jgi:hypothetical protein